MKRLFFSLALLLMSGAAGAASRPVDGKTTVIVLGVDHAAQLVARNDRPALLAAFLAHAKPDAICIERSPEAFARNDYYEFTYEVQDLVVSVRYPKSGQGTKGDPLGRNLREAPVH